MNAGILHIYALLRIKGKKKTRGELFFLPCSSLEKRRGSALPALSFEPRGKKKRKGRR